MKLRHVSIAMLTFVAVVGSSIALSGDDDSDLARRLLAEGSIVPLEQIIAKVHQVYPDSEVLEAKLEDENQQVIYELEIVDHAGVVRELYFDARNAELIKDKRED